MATDVESQELQIPMAESTQCGRKKNEFWIWGLLFIYLVLEADETTPDVMDYFFVTMYIVLWRWGSSSSLLSYSFSRKIPIYGQPSKN